MDNDVLDECFHKPEKEKFINCCCLFSINNCKLSKQYHENMIVKDWITLAPESEAQGAFRSSVNQKSESEEKSEA